MSQLLLTFYGDDFTGSTDALEQLTLAGIRAALFLEPPTEKQLRRFKGLRALGVAGKTRALPPEAMERELLPALKKLRALGAPHVHYKVCSTFDSSPKVGSIGRAIDIATELFPAPFVPLLVAAPALGRHCVFGNLFARFGIGSRGEIHRLDRHPSISQHPVTPMREADLRVHLAKQTKKNIALFDILNLALPEREARGALNKLIAGQPDIVLFDALYTKHLELIGSLIHGWASRKRPLFSVGSSGIEMALGAYWMKTDRSRRTIQAMRKAEPAKQILVGSGSCSNITARQITWALKHGFAEVPLNAATLASAKNSGREIQWAVSAAANLLNSGRSVIVHTTRNGSDRRIARQLKERTSQILGTALGRILRETVAQSKVQRICIAGGDTSSYAARAIGLEALEVLSPLTPGAPLCRARAPGSPVEGHEIVFKGGQVGAENYFEIVKRGSL